MLLGSPELVDIILPLLSLVALARDASGNQAHLP